MSYSCKVLADSHNGYYGNRLTTLLVTFPRIVLSEFNTHTILSKNSASSRAIPLVKRIEEVLTNPFIPEEFGVNQKGMSASSNLEGIDKEEAIAVWLTGRNRAIETALELTLGSDYSFELDADTDWTSWPLMVLRDESAVKRLNVHKQIVNRVLEPYLWHTVVVTGTEWDNFFKLRLAPDAQPEIRTAAEHMLQAMDESEAKFLAKDEWHTPFVSAEEYNALIDSGFNPLLVSAGRCARTSYLTHEGNREPQADVDLAKRLLGSGHMTPFEHQGTPQLMYYRMPQFSGKLRGFTQLRKMIPGEFDNTIDHANLPYELTDEFALCGVA